MTEAAILRMMIDGAVILAAACLFVRFLCDEYIRALELYGLIRRTAETPTDRRNADGDAQRNRKTLTTKAPRTPRTEGRSVG